MTSEMQSVVFFLTLTCALYAAPLYYNLTSLWERVMSRLRTWEKMLQDVEDDIYRGLRKRYVAKKISLRQLRAMCKYFAINRNLKGLVQTKLFSKELKERLLLKHRGSEDTDIRTLIEKHRRKPS
jgi:hypothetical protein